jgi:hypothetical protein
MPSIDLTDFELQLAAQGALMGAVQAEQGATMQSSPKFEAPSRTRREARTSTRAPIGYPRRSRSACSSISRVASCEPAPAKRLTS